MTNNISPWLLQVVFTTVVTLAFFPVCFCVRNKVDKVPYKVNPPPFDKEHVPKKCWNFTFGDWENMEFYSPEYPYNYPNSTECVTTLAAPVGYLIELDFRDHFMMESANDCRYDFLEVRDGPYGYSPLIGRYCGRTFPPWVESTGSFMWIRFKSDDILQYSGFRAVYNYKRNPAYDKSDNSTEFSVCRMETSVTEADGFISTADVPSIFKLQADGRPIECTWELRVPPHRKMLLDSSDFQVASLDDCDKNSLEIYDGTTLAKHRLKRYCVTTVIQIKSETNRLFIRAYGRSVTYMPTFKATLTTFSPGKCSKEQFDCGHNMCIDKDLACNGRSNCEDDSDEENCGALLEEEEKQSRLPTHAIILGVIGGVFFTVVTISICATCHAKRKERGREKAVKCQKHGHPENTVEMENLLNKHGTLPRNIPNGVLLKCGHATPTDTPPEPASTSDLSTATAEIHCPIHKRPDSSFIEPPLNLPDMVEFMEPGQYRRYNQPMDYPGYISDRRSHSPVPLSPISTVNIPEPEFFKKYYLATGTNIEKGQFSQPLSTTQLLGDPKLMVSREGRMRYLTLPRLEKPIQGNGQAPVDPYANYDTGEIPEGLVVPPYPSRLVPKKGYMSPERLISPDHPQSGRFQIGRHNYQ